MSPKFKIGQTFMPYGKHPKLNTIIDIHTTTNSAGEVVKFRYVATHEFMGQVITDYDVNETTVARGISGVRI